MEARISIITLGVTDLPLSVRFYRDGLNLPLVHEDVDDIAFFNLGGIRLALYPRHLLAEDACLPSEGSGFSGITLAHNVRSKTEVAPLLAQAEAAGATILKPAQDVFWGGHSGYFADPDGHLWEVAWNPYFKVE
jgi:uncharacterized protein